MSAYFDSAATSLQKPAAVRRAVARAMKRCANPGRGGHAPAMLADEAVFSCRKELAAFFGLSDPARVVLTFNATHALNLALRALLHDGGHIVLSGFEHNAVARPVEAMRAQGVRSTVARSAPFDPEACLAAYRAALRPDTACAVCCHVSNVYGCIQPLEEIDALCAQRGVPLIVDASQSAGAIPLDVSRLRAAAFVCMAGHKSLLGPQGTGVLLCCDGRAPWPILQGGTGSLSRQLAQPDFLPDALESGTLNVPGAAGLCAGVRFVRRVGLTRIRAHEQALCARLAAGLRAIPGVKVFSGPQQAGVLSFTAAWSDSVQLAADLGERGYCLRGGLHCAPLAHESGGTLEGGTVRAGFSPFNTAGEVDGLVQAVASLRP